MSHRLKCGCLVTDGNDSQVKKGFELGGSVAELCAEHGKKDEITVDWEEAISAVSAEIERAQAKFPTWPTDPLHALAVLGEEFGELTKSVLQVTYEPGKQTLDDVRDEATQTAAMALRFLASLENYAFEPQSQHEQINYD